MAIDAADLWVPPSTFADRLRQARRYAGLSQEELAIRLNIPTNRLGAWESGYSQPRRIVEVAKALEETIGVRSRWLLGLEMGESGCIGLTAADDPSGVLAPTGLAVFK